MLSAKAGRDAAIFHQEYTPPICCQDGSRAASIVAHARGGEGVAARAAAARADGRRLPAAGVAGKALGTAGRLNSAYSSPFPPKSGSEYPRRMPVVLRWRLRRQRRLSADGSSNWRDPPGAPVFRGLGAAPPAKVHPGCLRHANVVLHVGPG
jgi:hypothetical protein